MPVMNKQKLKISAVVIWVSSITIGLLSSVPQVAQQHFNMAEAAVNAGITSAFALLMWYVNIYMLSYQSERSPKRRVSYPRLVNSLLIGIVVMFGLAWIQQLILSHINFGPVMLMVEVRGILINLVF